MNVVLVLISCFQLCNSFLYTAEESRVKRLLRTFSQIYISSYNTVNTVPQSHYWENKEWESTEQALSDEEDIYITTSSDEEEEDSLLINETKSEELTNNLEETVHSLLQKTAKINSSVYNLEIYKLLFGFPCISLYSLLFLIKSVNSVLQVSLSKKEDWLGKIMPVTLHFLGNEGYVQKTALPVDSTVIIHGDIHGDMYSFRRYLEDLYKKNIVNNLFKIQDPQTYLLFLGDYVDRGAYGVEVLYAILCLKYANPSQCLLVRGNHESIAMNNDYGFSEEICLKYHEKSLVNIFSKELELFYNMLPQALYLSSTANPKEFVQCCHGGIEVGYDPSVLLTSLSSIKYEYVKKLNRENMVQSFKAFLACDETDKKPLSFEDEVILDRLAHSPDKGSGFLWEDFIVNKKDSILYDEVSGRISYGENFVKKWHAFLDQITMPFFDQESETEEHVQIEPLVIAIFRAHQHADEDMMDIMVHGQRKGSAWLWEAEKKQKDFTKLWKNVVVTFNVCPNTVYGRCTDDERLRFTFDSYGILTIGKAFENDWKLQIVTKDIYNKTTLYQ